MAADNRMGWIRNLSKIKERDVEIYTTEYELASECHITSVLNYDDQAILAGGMSFDSKPGRYLLKIKYKAFPEYEADKSSKDGYYFEGGIAGELVSLLSLFLQCRFFQVAMYQGELTPHGLRTKFEFPFHYQKCNPGVHPYIFDEKGRSRKFMDTIPFFDQLRSLDVQFHHSFALAARQYAIALRHVGTDEEMVFIRLVSAVEALSKHVELTSEEDPLSGKTLEEVMSREYQNTGTVEAMRSIFNTRKTSLKFRKFIRTYMGDNLPSVPPMQNTGFKWLTTENLDEVLQRIYTARSKYLHEGQLMYLSMHMNGGVGDFDPSVGMIIDNREFKEDEQLPYPYAFENLVRNCLLNFLKAHQVP